MTTTVDLDGLRDLWREVQDEKTPSAGAAPSPVEVEELSEAGAVPPAAVLPRSAATVRDLLLRHSGDPLDVVAHRIAEALA